MKTPSFGGNNVTRGQEALHAFVGSLPAIPPFGPAQSGLRGEAAADAVVIHRFTKKFERPSADRKNRDRAARTVERMLTYDAMHTTICWRQLEAQDRRVFLQAKDFISEALRRYKPTYRFAYPSNETYEPAKGDISLIAKLHDVSQWHVAPGAFDYAFRIVWANQSLRKLVKTHFRRSFDGTWRTLQKRFAAEVGEGLHIGFWVLRRMFKSLVTFTGVDRITTVPKDNDRDREITIAGLWTMICQLSIAADIKDTIRNSLGYNIEHIATLNKSRIANLCDATIDFSSASNSNWWEVVQELFAGTRVLKYIRQTRTGIVEWEGEYHPLNMMSPMGCGYTFEVMTLTLLAYARQFDKGATVFGDDVIIIAGQSQAFMRFASIMGWIVNASKSFSEGLLRESCGGFYNATVGHIVCYDFVWPETAYDLTVVTNKVRRIIVANQVSQTLRVKLLRLWIELVRVRSVGMRYPAHELNGEMIDFERPELDHTIEPSFAVISEVGPKIRPSLLVSRQLQRPVSWLKTGVLIKNKRRHLTKVERATSHLVRLLQPGHDDTHMRATRLIPMKTDEYGANYASSLKGARDPSRGA